MKMPHLAMKIQDQTPRIDASDELHFIDIIYDKHMSGILGLQAAQVTVQTMTIAGTTGDNRDTNTSEAVSFPDVSHGQECE